MKRQSLLIGLLILLVTISNSYAQFIPSVRVSSTSMKLNQKNTFQGTINDVAQINSIGVGPSINMESKRFLFQGSLLKHFNTEGESLISEDMSAIARRKASEFNFMVGYKLNANKDIQFYPFFTFGRYNLGIEVEETIDNQTLTLKDNIIFNEVGGGIGAHYIHNNFLFDLQVSMKESTGEDFFGSNFGVGFGVGYVLGGREN
ncbi:MAG: hypothetical protein AAFX87_27460 [Bacteroidota bacterium]